MLGSKTMLACVWRTESTGAFCAKHHPFVDQMCAAIAQHNTTQHTLTLCSGFDIMIAFASHRVCDVCDI